MDLLTRDRMSLAITAYCAKEEQDGGITLFL